VFLVTIRRLPGVARTGSADRLLTAFHGSVWTIIGFGASQFLRLAAMLILARHLLTPRTFGLVALVNVFLSGLALLSDLGIGTDVVQHRRGDEPSFINTAFLIQAGRGVALWFLASFLAYPFAAFYHQPEIFPLALVAAVSVLATGLTSGCVFTLTRHVRLRGLTLLRIGAEGAGLAVSVVWALVSPTAWALVAGRVVAESFFAVGTHLMAEQPISLRWDSAAAKDIMIFGAGMFASSATYFFAGEAERLVVGKFVDLVLLGCFSLALSITAALTGGFQRLIAQVFYPMIAASARTDLRTTERHFRTTRLVLLVASIFLAATSIIGGPWIVAMLLGPKYLAAGWILQLLGFRAALELFTSATTQMLFALGTSIYAAFGNLAKLGYLAVGLTIAFGRFGFREAVWVLATSSIVAYVPLLFGFRRHFNQALSFEILTFFGLIASSGVAASFVSHAA
jgi:O-antigen/teichoic acid export membrane protein